MTSPVQARPAESAGRRALWLAFAAVVMTFLLPLAGLVMSIFALVVAIRAIPTLRSVSKPTGTAVTGIVLAALALPVSLSMAAMQLYLSDELSAYSDCRAGAGTVVAQKECVDQLEQALQKKMPFIQPGDIQFPFTP
ncbi:hypothetical protein [Streptosporangium saharense]|uniref:DUF4190 domain-containing protein n=1 Tax=Streptosporangium saharense TaxID=1706840 RepID=A0A7W7VKV5_9ACTN|nr:hypothetical protein [Streptosporangium saharense]MBB4914101.1 hypothetical protein [Streptosporangium saharense]